MKKITYSLLALTMFQVQNASASNFHGTLLGNVGSSQLNGFTQVPQGGTIGTTSIGRPTLHELNINHNNFYTIGAKIDYEAYNLLFTYSRFAPRGRTNLKNILNTHGKQIKAGASLSTLIKYDFYTLSFGRNFNFASWMLEPFAQIDLLKFHYEYAAYPIKGSRSYNVMGANIGLKATYPITTTVSFDMNLTPPLPITNFTNALFEVGLNKQLALTKHILFHPRFAVGVQQLDYEDNQPVPNHILLKNIPYALLGLKVSCF